MLPHQISPSSSGAAISATSLCDNCQTKERILHKIHHRPVYGKFCTICVLHLYRNKFCPICLALYDTDTSLPNDVVVNCDKCRSKIHRHCLSIISSDPYKCQICVNSIPHLIYLRNEPCKNFEMKSAKMLLLAATIVAATMKKAALLAKEEAEMAVSKAVMAREKVKEALRNLHEREEIRNNGGRGAVMMGGGDIPQSSKRKFVVMEGSDDANSGGSSHRKDLASASGVGKNGNK